MVFNVFSLSLPLSVPVPSAFLTSVLQQFFFKHCFHSLSSMASLGSRIVACYDVWEEDD